MGIYDLQLEQDLLEALRNDATLSFKETTKYFESGRCPDCDQKTVFISKLKPGRLACNRINNCSYEETTRERYADLYEDLGDKFPATPEDPNATAKAYMSTTRGFPLVHVGDWFTQGVCPLTNGKQAPTVRFQLWDGFYWERLINAVDVRIRGDKNHIKKGLSYKGKCWTPPSLAVEPNDTIYIVEGIFHAMALTLSGFKAVAAISSNNLPRDFITAHSAKNITWALGYDNDPDNGAGVKAAVKYREELRQALNQSKIQISLCPVGQDWDDIYRQGKLDGDFMAECLQRGRVATAESLEEKAYWLYCRRSYNFNVIDFNSRLYSVAVGKFAEELSKAIEEAAQSDIEGKDKKELHKATIAEALATDIGRQLFYTSLDSVTITNCLPRFLYSQVDKITNEITYFFVIDFPNAKRPRRFISLPGSAVESPASFNKAILNHATGATFDGSAMQLKRIRDGWFNGNVLEVESVPFVGYDKDSQIYVYPDFAFYQGRYFKPNKSGFIQAGKRCIKTTLKSIDIQHSKTFSQEWVNDFFTVFNYNGLAVLGFFLGSLFAEQIRKEIHFFPFLELTGEAGSGKTTLLEFCWKLLGRDKHEGFNPSKATFAARSRAFTQVSNMPLALIEGDSRDGGKDSKKGGFDYSELKDLFNGRGIRATGAFNRGNDIEEPPFRGTVLIAQNASVDGDEAILTRIVHLHATRAHQTRANKPLADSYRRADVKAVCGFLVKALESEKVIVETIIENYRRLDEQLAKDEKLKTARVTECHALIAATVCALPLVIPALEKSLIDETITHLHGRALDRQERLNADHPTVQSFWEIYDLINVQTVTEARGYPGKETEFLNHAKDPALIAINLQEFNKHSELNKMERLDLKDLRRLLPNSQRHKFIGHKTVKSNLADSAGRWCAVFKNGEFKANQ